MNEPVKEFYIYEVDFLTLGASASNSAGTFVVDSNADFVLSRTMVDHRSNSTGTWVDPAQVPVTVTWQNATTGRSYTSGAVPIPNLYGTAQRPHILTAMLLIPAKSTFVVTLTNLSASAAYLRLSHEGFKQYLA